MKLVQARSPNTIIDIVPTESLSDGFVQAKHIHNKGYDLLVAAGGDGTVLSVVNGVVHSGTLFTTLPLGTGNDYAKAMGIHSVEDAVEAIFRGTVKQADAGHCTFRDSDGKQQQLYFCSTAGIGLFARISELEKHRLSRWLKMLLKDGVWPLLAAASIFSTKNIPTKLLVNKHQITTDMLLFEVSNVPKAGGFLLTPFASINSETFDSWMVHHVNVLERWRIFLTALANKAGHLDYRNVEYFTSQPDWNRYGYTKLTRIEVEPAQPLPVHLNGDLMGQTPALFEMMPKSLNVLVLS